MLRPNNTKCQSALTFDRPVSLAQSFVQRTFAKPFRLGALLAAVDELVGAAAQPGLPGAVAVP